MKECSFKPENPPFFSQTRVILPMLVLEWGAGSRAAAAAGQVDRGPVQRIHFVSALVDEAYEYLHLHLTASVLQARKHLL